MRSFFRAFLLLAPVICTVQSCKKSAPSLSYHKEIKRFIFRQADHPGLYADIEGSITYHSVKCYVKPGTDITNRKPYITYDAKTITPESEVAHDFSTPVNY